MKCRINKRGEQVLTPNMKDSKLFNSLKEVFDFKEALDIYSITETVDFKLYQNALGKEATMEQLLTFANRLPATNVGKEVVIEMMQATSIQDSAELLDRLSKIQSNGLFIFTEASLRKTGLFDRYEISQILKTNGKQERIQNIYKTLSNSDDFQIVTAELENGGAVTSFGKIEKVESEMKNPQYVYGITSEVITQLSSLESERLANTLSLQENEELSKNIYFLRNYMTPTSWSQSGDVAGILRSIENQAKDNGIDLRGLSDQYGSKSRQEILGVLEATELLLEGTIQPNTYSNLLDVFFDKRLLQDRDIPSTDIIVRGEHNEGDMFNNYKLIRVSKDVWRRVPDAVLQTPENIDTTLNTDIQTAEQISAFKEVLGIDKYIERPNSDKLDQFMGDIDYLNTEFTPLFGRWLLKNNNNFFQITEEGITLTDKNRVQEAMESLPKNIKEDLTQYSLLSKNLELYLPQVINEEQDYEQSIRDRVKNNPSILQSYPGDVQKVSDMLVINNNNSQFINVKNQGFEKVYELGDKSFYKSLGDNTGPLMTKGVIKPEVTENMNVYTSLMIDASPFEQVSQDVKEIEQEYFECGKAKPKKFSKGGTWGKVKDFVGNTHENGGIKIKI